MKKSPGLTPKEIRKQLLEKWNRGYYFKHYRECFPLQISLGKISSRQMTEGFEELRRWIGLYTSDPQFSSCLQWEEVNHRLLGKNTIPRRLLFPGPKDLADFLNRREEWNRFMALGHQLEALHGRLLTWAEKYPLELLRIAPDLDRLILLWKWMISHQRPGIYLRQIDISGIDSKFTENYRKVLSAWLDQTLPQETVNSEMKGISRFEDRYGYRSKPELIRFRFLDPSLNWHGCSDLSVPAEAFCQIYSAEDRPVEQVFVVENDITALSFPPVEKGMVVFGRGYHFDHWKNCLWLHDTALYYWGDLDTHGFRILDQFRSYFPHAQSFLMDRKTLLAHEASWGEEGTPQKADLSRLTPQEQDLYDDFRFNRIRTGLRLEQEFIGMGCIEEELQA